MGHAPQTTTRPKAIRRARMAGLNSIGFRLRKQLDEARFNRVGRLSSSN
jgi:hypothetical protein